MYPIDYFGDGAQLDFEGHMFKVPAHYEEILSRLFGNYMELPPEEKRVSHQLIEIDFGKYDAELEELFASTLSVQ